MAGKETKPVLGLLGVGTIGEAVVRGLLALPECDCPFRMAVVSPRNREKSSALAASFPGRAVVAESNQSVLDGCSTVIIGLHHKKAKEIMSPLSFRADHRVISLMSCVVHQDLAQFSGNVVPISSIFRATPLPAVAKHEGTTVVYPPNEEVERLFQLLGTCVSVPDAASLLRMQVPTALMGDFYKRCAVVREWLVTSGVDGQAASKYLGSLFSTIVRDAKDRSADESGSENAFEELVAEQTPGGLNEHVVCEQEKFGSYEMLRKSLETVHGKFAAA